MDWAREEDWLEDCKVCLYGRDLMVLDGFVSGDWSWWLFEDLIGFRRDDVREDVIRLNLILKLKMVDFLKIVRIKD